MDIVEEFKKIGFNIITRGWFTVLMQRDNIRLNLSEELSTMDIENPETGNYAHSVKVHNLMLLDLIKKGKESDILTIQMPF